MFKFDPNSPKGGQGRWRLRDPKDFKRFWTEKDKDNKGISYIKGQLKSGGSAIQAIRFERPEWSENRASKWWSKHKGSFKKSWQESDWTKWKKSHKKKEAQLEFLVASADYLDEIGEYETANIIDQIIKTTAKKWNDADHDWSQILIQHDDKTLTRGQIRDYYTKNATKILPYIKDKDAIVLIGTAKNKTILKRNDEDGKRIHITKAKGIDDPESIEYWAARRMIELHEAIPNSQSRVLWIDYDPHSAKMKPKAKKAAIEGGKIIKSVFPSARIELYQSGKRGFHTMGFLDKAVDVDDAREKLKEALKEKYADDPDITTGLAKEGQIRADITTLHKDGSLRAPYSLSIYGEPKIPIKTNSADDDGNGVGLEGDEEWDAIAWADDEDYADDRVVSFMRLKKIKSPEDLLKDYKPEELIVQQKIDGLKVEAIKDGTTQLFTRRGKDITANIPDLVAQLNKQLPNGTAVLGELSVLVDGKQSISAAQGLMGSKSSQNVKGDVVYYVYDVLQYKGKDTTDKPFVERDKLLRGMLKTGGKIQLLHNYSFAERERAMKDALKIGGEGVVLKLKSSHYEDSPSGASERFGKQWKYKPAGVKSNLEDVVLKEYTLGGSDSKGHRKAVFPAYQFNGNELFEVGKVSGMDRDTETDLMKKIDAGKKVVVEVSFQDRLPSGKMRHMGWVRERPDKPLRSATIEKE